MASIRTDDGPDGMRNDFEQSAVHLLPYDPVARKHAAGSSKRGSAEVSAVSFETTDVAAFGTKPGIGKSGVHFRYYDKSKYSKLREWRKGGAERPKIQVNDPTTSDHSIYFPETDFRIPLSLWGVFSYFPSSKPTAQTLQETEEVYLLTPSRWNPHCDSYAQNEENMLDWEGNMVGRKDRMQILSDNLPDGAKTVGSTQISKVKSARIHAIVEARDYILSFL